MTAADPILPPDPDLAEIGPLPLAADFPATTDAGWEQLAAAVLRKSGAETPEGVRAALSTTTPEGLRLAPLYTPGTPGGSHSRADRRARPAPVHPRRPANPSRRPHRNPQIHHPAHRHRRRAHRRHPARRHRPPSAAGTAAQPAGSAQAAGAPAGVPQGGWDIRQRHADPDPAATREAVLADLEGGVTSLWLVVGPAALAVDGLATALDGVYLDLAGITLDAGADPLPAATELFALAAKQGVDPTQLRGSLGVDPLGWQGRTGAPADFAALRTLALRCANDSAGLRAATVDATVFHDAGGTDAQELALSLAVGVAYLRELTDAGLAVPAALGQLEFRYAATVDQFATVAKLRAARRLWARVAQVCGATDAGAQRQHAVTSSAMMTGRDPWVNMLRVTVAAVAAAIGGADAITVQPFDARLGLPDGFARRIARNTQTVLQDESNIGRVLDPAGGSWYVEARTEALAQAAWALFTEVERAGGMATALRSGLVADWLATSWSERADSVAHRREPITGVSEYPNLTETLPIRAQPASAAAPPDGGEGLPAHRYAEQFEALRDRADAATAAHGARPTVFLATLGPLAAHAARATFAGNLLAAGGIATLSSGPSVDPEELAARFAASGARLACLCGNDASYAELAEPTAAALAARGGTTWLAGRPNEYPGITGFLYSGMDVVAALTDCLSLLDA